MNNIGGIFGFHIQHNFFFFLKRPYNKTLSSTRKNGSTLNVVHILQSCSLTAETIRRALLRKTAASCHVNSSQ